MSEIITGADGQLGRALQEQFPDAHALTRDDLDISDPEAVRAFDFSEVKTIINAAAYTQVDEAETPDGTIAAFNVNSQGTANLAAIANDRELTLLHVSTDYVFDGNKDTPYDENDPISPLSVYGRSKAAGELAAQTATHHYIVRTSWVIGDGNNFARTMLSLAERGIDPAVVDDQIGRPSFTVDLARAVEHLVMNSPEPGIYHCSNGGKPTSFADFARAIFETSGHDSARVSGTSTADYFADKPQAAARPLNSVFSLDKITETGYEPRDWRDALEEYVQHEANRA